MIEIATNIKRLRELKGITREVMSSEFGLSLSGYAKLERNETELTVSKLYKIAEVLEVGVNELLNFDASKIFNISNNEYVQGAGAENLHLHNHQSTHTDKYIAVLEKENERLQKLVEKHHLG